MPQKTPIKRVRVKKENFAIVHVCTEKEQINRLSQILVGNGKPEEGYVYKVLEMGKQVAEINNRITGIHAVVNELHEASVGVKAVEKSVQQKRNEFIKFISIIIGALSLVVTAWFSYKGTKTSEINSEKIEITNQKVDNIGTPVIVGPRGDIKSLSIGDSLKYFRDGEFKNFEDK